MARGPSGRNRLLLAQRAGLLKRKAAPGPLDILMRLLEEGQQGQQPMGVEEPPPQAPPEVPPMQQGGQLPHIAQLLGAKAGAQWGGHRFLDLNSLWGFEQRHGNKMQKKQFLNLHPALLQLLGRNGVGPAPGRGTANSPYGQ